MVEVYGSVDDLIPDKKRLVEMKLYFTEFTYQTPTANLGLDNSFYRIPSPLLKKPPGNPHRNYLGPISAENEDGEHSPH